jgi:hypothetical protein
MKSIKKFQDFVNEGKVNKLGSTFIIKNGFTFTTIDGHKFTIPRKAEIEIISHENPGKATWFTITKGKLDGHPSLPKGKEFGVSNKDFEDYLDSNDIELNESVNESYMDNYHNYYIAKHVIEYGSPMWVKKTEHVPKGTIMLSVGGGRFESIDSTIHLPQEISSVNGIPTKKQYDIRKDKDNYEEVSNTTW